MNRIFRAAAVLPMVAGLFCAPSYAQSVPSIRKVDVLRGAGQVEIEIEASDRVVPQANLLKNPDRLIVDFVNAVPGAQLHPQAVNRGEVKNVRIGLFSKNPPVTRIVLDLTGPQPYKVFPSGRTVIVKVGGTGPALSAGYHDPNPVLTNSNYSAAGAHLSVETPPPPRPTLQVNFRDGQLTIFSNKANLSEVLFAIHERTGADIAIPAGAEQEQVVAQIGPGPAPQVLSQLLNGSKFNFLILSSSSDPKVLDRVILTSKPEGPMPPPARSSPAVMTASADEDDSDSGSKMATPVVRPAPGVPPAPGVEGVSGDKPPAPGNAPETKPTDSNDVPD